MPTEQASAVPDPGTPTAAETTAPAPNPQATAGAEGGAQAPAAETHPSPNPSPTTGDTVAGEADRLLAGANTVADLQRIAQMIPPVGAEPAAPVEEEVPALPADGSLPDRVRIKHLPEAHREAINRLLRNPDANVDELFRAPAPAGPTAEPVTAPAATAPPTEAAPAAPVAPVPVAPALAPLPTVTVAPPTQTVEAVQAEIDRLGEEQDAALGRADMERASALNKQLRTLNATLTQTQRQATLHERDVARVQSAHQEHATSLYPDVVVAGSPLHNAVQKLYDQYKTANSPILATAEWPSLLTAAAASALGIAPRTAATAPATPPIPAAPATPPLKPAPVSAPTPRAAAPAATPPAPAAGNARTQAPSPAASQAQSEQALASIKDSNDILSLTRGL